MPIYEVEVLLTIEADREKDAALVAQAALDNLVSGDITDAYVGQIGEV